MFVGYKRFTLTASTGDQTVTGIVDDDGNAIDFTGTGEPFVLGFMGLDDDGYSQSYFAATGTSGAETISITNHCADAVAANSDYALTGGVSFRRQATFGGANVELMTFTVKTWGDGQITFNKTVAGAALTVVMLCGIAANAQVVDYVDSGSTGDDDDAQLSWTPSSNAIMFLGGGIFAADPYTRTDGRVFPHFGVASEDAQFAHGHNVIHGTAQCICTHKNSDSDLILYTEYTSTVFEQASFVQWIANGFRLNYSINNGSSWHRMILVIDDGSGGDQCRAALWTTSGSTGSESFDSGDATGKTPQLVYLQSDGEVADYTTTENGAYISYGFGNSQGQDSYRLSSQDKGTPSGNSHQDFDATSCMTIVNDSNVVQDDIDFDAVAADGFDVTHDTNGGAKFVGVALMGLSSGGGGGATIPRMTLMGVG